MDAGGSEGENKEAFNGNSLDVLKSTHSWRVLEEHAGIEEYGFENEKRRVFTLILDYASGPTSSPIMSIEEQKVAAVTCKRFLHLFSFLFFFILLVTTTGSLARRTLVEQPRKTGLEQAVLEVRAWAHIVLLWHDSSRASTHASQSPSDARESCVIDHTCGNWCSLVVSINAPWVASHLLTPQHFLWCVYYSSSFPGIDQSLTSIRTHYNIKTSNSTSHEYLKLIV
ncbi:hypothetical protein SDJN03_00960, partial [Cucurbita argyrosperma subsp. sororia]